MGESAEVEKCDYGGNGWQVKNHIERNKLLFGKVTDNAKLITGETCLKSELERIIARIRDGSLEIGNGIKIFPIDQKGNYNPNE